MKVPVLDLHPAYAELRGELDAAYRRVMDSGRYLLGPELEAFEQEYASSVGCRHTIGVANGLEALQLALSARGIGPGDEVIVPSNGYIATWLAVSHVGAEAVPVEPDPATYNLDPARVADAITRRTKVILPIHLYGQTADMTPLKAIAGEHGLWVLEDAAQSHGALCSGVASGNLGHAAGVSFYPSKNLGAFADAGAVTTSDDDLAAKLRMLRNYGSAQRYHHEAIGLNSRMDELTAAFLRVRLGHLTEWNARRAAQAKGYGARLAGVGDLVMPRVPDWAQPAWHLFVVRTQRRPGLRAHLEALGVGTQIHYPIPPHLSGAYAARGGKRGDYPIAEQLADEVLSLPIGPHLTGEQIDYVCDSIRSFFQGGAR
jgi:dTDP-3-amino-3,4,6-trideoxy-alpha-D-glucose transaminase